MDFLQYLLKFSISLAVLYIFYRAVLRPLTFYRCNRFYLLCYSLLSFVIPFINISPWVEKDQEHSSQLVNIIPAIANYTVDSHEKPEAAQYSFLQHISTNQWLLLLFCIGTFFMLARVIRQYLSLRHIRSKSVLLNSSDDVHLYQTDAPVSPFSFGNAIYFNSSLHTEDELQRIIQHEFVHVKQKHSVDILLGELLCILNWFNPFAWLIRHAIRQNLEFIADNDVIRNGIDKKEYQYLLLKVVGIPQYSIANNFNFSSLKKRIAMMNKMKSAKLHLTKFMFVLPLLAVLLLAFRNKLAENKKEFVFTGIVYDAKTQQPLQGVAVIEKYSGMSAATDANGFFKMKVPLGKDSIFKLSCNLALTEYENKNELSLSFNPMMVKTYSDLVFTAMRKKNDPSYDAVAAGTHYEAPFNSEKIFVADPDYSFVQAKFQKFQMKQNQNASFDMIDAVTKDSKKPIWIINGVPYAIGNFSRAWFNADELKTSPGFKVWVDGKIMSMDEANALVNRFELNHVRATSGENSLKRYGINGNVLALYWKTKDTIPGPPPPPVPPAGTTITDIAPAGNGGLPENVSNISHRTNIDLKGKLKEDIVTVTLKNGVKEVYNFYNANEKAAYIKKYGEFPQAPAPPPPAAVPGVPAIIGYAPATATPPVITIDAVPPVSKGTNSDKVENISTQESTDKKAGTHSYTAVVTLKDGTVEKYNLSDPKERAVYIKKYGPLPKLLLNESHENAESLLFKIDSISGSHSPITINGRGKISEDKRPLYVIDGIAQPLGVDVNDINPEKISSITVLKDKSATIMYGDKAANGAVLITLKKPSETNTVSPDKTQSVSVLLDKMPKREYGYSANAGKVNSKPVQDTGYFPKDLLVFIDGKEIPAGSKISDYIQMEKIQSITIVKDKTATDKYGERANKGVIEIITKNTDVKKDGTAIKKDKVIAVPDSTLEGSVSDGIYTAKVKVVKNSFVYFPKDILLILDKKELPAGANIDDYAKKGDIGNFTMSIGESAVEKYGEKARRGVIIIETKNKNEKKDGTAMTQYPVTAHFDNLICNGQMTGNGNENLIDGSFSFEIKSHPPLVIVDGTEIAGCTSYKAEKGKYKMIALNSKQGIAKYGDKAKNGVLEITSLDKNKNKAA